MSSLTLIEIPKTCNSYLFQAIFEHCLKNYNMVVLGVRKMQLDEGSILGE